MAKIAEQHHTDVVKIRLGGDATPSWKVRCSCGYAGRPQLTRRDAEDDADEHVRQSIDPSDRIR